ncbi:hypothetical protein HPB52_014959 [Rhipicephalus sanguineus]|uniref:ISXO2-like transposase domain-containing protein n=1 Tax=Rhipicephalus sanguineus TaxID=34632 RepID=A0A9D4PD06_RHISA|nr:hypothetical protein HPB52_014959 [Rhipicephalus sanguineus]
MGAAARGAVGWRARRRGSLLRGQSSQTGKDGTSTVFAEGILQTRPAPGRRLVQAVRRWPTAAEAAQSVVLAGESRRNNYGGVSDKGPWIFGMLCVSTKELRLFEVDKRDAATLGPLIAKNVLPGTTVFSEEWAAYRSIPGLVNANGTPLNLDWHTVNHSVNFIDPATGANTQRIESEWQKAKRRLVRNCNKTTPALMRSHLAWL